jgi:hypothetical protein
MFNASAAYKTLKQESNEKEWALIRDLLAFVPAIGYTAYRTRIVNCFESVIGNDKQDYRI